MTDLTFNQLVDVTMVRQLLESHQRLSGMAYGLFDTDGNDIVSVGWQDICVRFHRVHPVTCELCRESNAAINSRLHDATDSFVEYRCPNGMIDAAIPIVMDGRHMATFFTGQFFYDDDPPDREFFIAQAEELGFERDDYLRSLEQVPALSRQHVRENMLFLRDMAQLLAKMGFANLAQVRESRNILAEAQRIAHLGSWELDITDNSLVWSDEIFRIFEIDRERFGASYEAFLDTIHPDDRDMVHRAYTESLKERIPYQIEHRLLFPDGRIKYVHERCETRYSPDSTPLRSVGTVQDITERKRMEEALAAQERKFRLLAENSPDSVVRYAPDGRRMYVNPEFERLTGKTAAQLVNETAASAPVTSSSSVNEQLQRTIAGVVKEREPRTVEFEWTDKNGVYHCFLNRYVPEFGPSGEVQSVLSVACEISGQRRLEKALAAREREFRTLAENTPDNIARWDTAGRILYSNPTHQKTLDKSAIEMIGKTHGELFPDDRYSQIDQAIAHIAATGEERLVRALELRKNNETRIHEVKLVPERDEDGTVVSVLGLGRDITENYRLQEAIAARELEFRTLAENLPDNIARYDAGCRVSYYNPRLCRILRLSASPLGKTPMELHPGGEYRGYQDILERVLATGEESELDIDDVDTEGREMTHNIRFVAERGANGEITGVLAIGRDITERKRMENELQNKNAELERFTYTVSHDLKSPLVTIRSFSGSIKQDLASGRHDRLETDLGRIRSAADKMGALLDDLLKLSRSGHVINAPVPVDMAKLVDDVLKNMAGNLKETGVQVNVQPGLPTVMCDRQRMMEVLQNLIENGVKYRGEQPEPRIVVGLRQENGRQVFFVRDNGPGIEPRHHENIFGLFNRLSRHLPGTGIGLAVVKRIIEAHGGSIWVESDGQGNGCTFCFTVG